MKTTARLRTLLPWALLAGSLLALRSGWPLLVHLGRAGVALALLLIVLWLARLAWRHLLWRVGRRLAVSYFLLGVLPLAMLALLLLVGGYLLAGFFLGHLYRDATLGVQARLSAAAAAGLERLADGERPAAPDGAALAWYRHGHRIAGDPRAPDRFPVWLAGAEAGGETAAPAFASLADGRIALAVARQRGPFGVVALRAEGLEAALAEGAGAVVRLYREDDPARRKITYLEIGGRRLALGSGRGQGGPAAAEFEARFPWTGEGPRPFRERPLVHWVELSGPLRDLASGAESADFVSVSLVASPAALREQLHSTSAEVDTSAWLLFLVLAAVLLDIYVIAAAVALFMIVGLSRAVNRLSRSTGAIAGGDFSVRIPVRRQDQLGELQRSFNAMAAHLEELVTTAAQKEALDKELELARRLQQDLLPREALQLPGVQFATHFEPSAAIGGDYFDLLRVQEETLAVVIADVAGHGLPAGLRMAMLKAALQILVENGESPAATLRRLGEMIRTERPVRTFVTATLGQLHLPSGRLRLTNAGHPPTYLLRGGRVEEILLPSPPLGTFDQGFAEREIALAPGDLVVWLSDGFVESRDPEGEPFGYERIQAALAGPAPSPEAVRDRLLAAVARHGRGRPADDDRTLVALAYRGVFPGEIPNRS